MGINGEHWLPPSGMALPSVPSHPTVSQIGHYQYNTGAAGGSIVKRKTNRGERYYKRNPDWQKEYKLLPESGTNLGAPLAPEIGSKLAGQNDALSEDVHAAPPVPTGQSSEYRERDYENRCPIPKYRAQRGKAQGSVKARAIQRKATDAEA